MSNTNLVPACTRCNGNCWGCFYAEICPQWNDESLDVPMIEEVIHND
jgi:hypothetical protein